MESKAYQFKALFTFETAWKARDRDFKVDIVYVNPKPEFPNTGQVKHLSKCGVFCSI